MDIFNLIEEAITIMLVVTPLVIIACICIVIFKPYPDRQGGDNKK